MPAVVSVGSHIQCERPLVMHKFTGSETPTKRERKTEEVPLIIFLTPMSSHRHPKQEDSLRVLASCGFDFQLVEVRSVSEVARARNMVATKARHVVEANPGCLVMWLDADMVILSPQTFLAHIRTVQKTGKAISGRYVRRQNTSRVAAAIDDAEHRQPIALNDTTRIVPVRSGLGCLMMTDKLFLQHLYEVPTGKIIEHGIAHTEYLVCCPRLVQIEDGYSMLSEDFDYCDTLPGGAWFYEEKLQAGVYQTLDYGHVTEIVAAPAAGPLEMVDDRL